LRKLINKYTRSSQQDVDDEVEKQISLAMSPIKRQVILLVTQMLMIVFIGAAVVKILNLSLPGAFFTGAKAKLYYLDAFYFMIVTAATIGFGDVSPALFVSRMVMVFIVLSVFAIFGENISKIGRVMRETNFENKFYSFRDHIVVMGTLEVRDLERFFLSLLDKEGIDKFPRVIIIGDKKI
jgi:potassium channel subfamily T protein 1